MLTLRRLTFGQLFRSLIVALCLCYTPFALSLPYTNIFVFGDSLSDSGNVAASTGGRVPGAPYFAGRASNGLNYADVLAAGLGLDLTASLTGGNSFAYGGARTRTNRFGLSLQQQVQAYVDRDAVADPGALYVFYGGSNNIQDALVAASRDPPNALAIGNDAVIQALGDVATMLNTLAVLGAHNFLVPNLPNVGLVPRIQALGNPGLAQFGAQLGVAFNTGLEQILTGLDAGNNVFRLDVFSAFQDIVNDPAAFGITNVTDRCYTGDDINFTGGGTVCANPDQFLFWDGIHPTAGVHARLGRLALAAVAPEPGTALLLCLGVMAIGYRKIQHSKSSVSEHARSRTLLGSWRAVAGGPHATSFLARCIGPYQPQKLFGREGIALRYS